MRGGTITAMATTDPTGTATALTAANARVQELRERIEEASRAYYDQIGRAHV